MFDCAKFFGNQSKGELLVGKLKSIFDALANVLYRN